MRKIFAIALKFVFVVFVLILPLPAAAAQVLQVRSSSVLQIGDSNRSYTVQLACIEADPNYQEEGKIWLKEEMPRGLKVNLRPEGVKDGVLIAKVKLIGKNIDLSDELVEKGFANKTC